MLDSAEMFIWDGVELFVLDVAKLFMLDGGEMFMLDVAEVFMLDGARGFMLGGAEFLVSDVAKLFMLDSAEVFMLDGTVIIPVYRRHCDINCLKYVWLHEQGAREAIQIIDKTPPCFTCLDYHISLRISYVSRARPFMCARE